MIGLLLFLIVPDCILMLIAGVCIRGSNNPARILPVVFVAIILMLGHIIWFAIAVKKHETSLIEDLCRREEIHYLYIAKYSPDGGRHTFFKRSFYRVNALRESKAQYLYFEIVDRRWMIFGGKAQKMQTENSSNLMLPMGRETEWRSC